MMFSLFPRRRTGPLPLIPDNYGTPRAPEKRARNGPRYSSDLRQAPTCKHCGVAGLNWQQVKGSKWRLHEGSKPHVCANTAEGLGDA